MTLLLYVNNQTLRPSDAQSNIEIVADSRNYLKVKFMFQTSDWKNDLPKYVLFTRNGKTYKKYLGIEDGVEYNECYVAPEVIKAGKFSISVFCENLITTNAVEFPVVASGYTNNIVNQPTTPSVLEQMNTLMYKYANVCNDILKECKRIENRLQEGKK